MMEHTKLEQQLVQQQHRVAEAVISLAQGNALEPILRHVGELAMQLTGAHYAMLAYNVHGKRIHIPLGMTEQELARMEGDPQGIGLLGLMWDKHEVVRVNDIGHHPKAAGFPNHHPPMTTFLGAPIMFGNEVHGVIYLTDKQGGRAFDPLDETVVSTLASACAMAISNAIHIEELEARNAELEHLLAERRSTDH
jgi:GAF domain-containing protein